MNNSSSNKKLYIIITMLIGIGALVYWTKAVISPDVVSSLNILQEDVNKTKIVLNATRATVNITSANVNITKDAIQNISFNQNVSFQNQKILAKGINSLGNALIPKIENVQEKANLIDDIKFGVDKILNKTEVKNITISNLTD
jgi:hypothetical protein